MSHEPLTDLFQGMFISLIQSPKYWKCVICDMMLTSRWLHYQSHRVPRIFCRFCIASYTGPETMKRHVMSKHSDRYNEILDFRLDNEARHFESYRLVKQHPPIWMCLICCYKMPNSPTPSDPFSVMGFCCPYCTVLFHCSLKLDNHIQRRHRENVSGCNAYS